MAGERRGEQCRVLVELTGADDELRRQEVLALLGQPGLSLFAASGAEETDGMKSSPDPHYRHWYPAEVLSHAVLLSHVLSLSLQDMQLLLAERNGVTLSYETVRWWCQKLAGASRTLCAGGGLVRTTSGIWMRPLSGSKAFSITAGC